MDIATTITQVPGLRGPAGIIWRGAWADAAVYAVHDVVRDEGSSWISVEAHTASEANRPGLGDEWELFAAAGDEEPSAPTLVDDDYSVVASDHNKVKELNSATDKTISLPAGLATGVLFKWIVMGAGVWTFVAGAGATITNRQGLFETAGEGATGTANLLSGNRWVVDGDLA